MLDEFTARNNAALQDLVDNHGVQLRRLPDDVLQALYRSSEQALQELTANDPLSARVYASYREFYEGVRAYHHISEQSYINARDEVMDRE
jgi:TRAP-type mannitol/chloroaromatic compound transport system substrate-binding protein